MCQGARPHNVCHVPSLLSQGYALGLEHTMKVRTFPRLNEFYSRLQREELVSTHLYSFRTYLCAAFSFSSSALRLAASSRFRCVAALLSRLHKIQADSLLALLSGRSLHNADTFDGTMHSCCVCITLEQQPSLSGHSSDGTMHSY